MEYSMRVRIESEARTIKFFWERRGQSEATQQEKQWGHEVTLSIAVVVNRDGGGKGRWHRWHLPISGVDRDHSWLPCSCHTALESSSIRGGLHIWSCRVDR